MDAKPFAAVLEKGVVIYTKQIVINAAAAFDDIHRDFRKV